MSTAKTTTAAPTSKSPAPQKAAAKPAAKKATVKATVKAPLSKAIAPAKSVKPVSTAKPVKTVKTEKAKKPKLVRDSFTIPKLEYVVLEALKQRASQLKRPIKKSELLRAGIKALAALADTAFLNALDKVPAIKTGRPASGK